MSGQRYNPAQSDNRFPRERSPSRPANYPPVHPSRSTYLGPSSNDQPSSDPAPRAPKAHGDFRSSGPSPTRGRGFSSRGEVRGDFRDRDGVRGPRDPSPPADRPWREFDRRESDADAGRGRRGFRDGPQSRFGDTRAPPYQQRDDFSRGRGRGDWAPRGRGRGSYDERQNHRARSRSPRGYRPAWDQSRDDRDRQDDRYENPRFERRESDQALDREERAREAERYRRERSSLSINPVNRQSNNSPSAISPSVGAPPSAGFGSRRPSSSELDRFPPRRQSSTTGGRGQQVESISRPPSPPQAAPEVPAFGSISHRSNSGDGPWNVWRAPTEPKAAAPQQQQPGQQPPGTKTGEMPARAPDFLAPSAPKALRTDATPRDDVPGRPGDMPASTSPVASTRSPTLLQSLEPASRAPTGPRSSLPPGPKAQLQTQTSPSLGPKVNSQLKALASPPSGAPASAPLGPRGLLPSSTPQGPKFGIGGNIPTGPRSARGPFTANAWIPAAPAPERSLFRSRVDHGPNKSPGALIPAKRDHEGTEIAATSDASGYDETGPDASETGITIDGRGSVDPAETSTVEGRDGSRVTNFEPQTETEAADPAVPGAANNMRYSDDEDDMDISELDSAQNEEKFERNKARLEGMKIDLSSDALRATTILRQMALLNCLLLQDPSSFFEAKQAKTQVRQLSEAQTGSETPRNDDAEDAEPARNWPRVTPSPVSTPMLLSLPYHTGAPLTPMSELDAIQENIRRQELAQDALTHELGRRETVAADDEEHLRAEFIDKYRAWRVHTRELDRQQKEREEAERQESAEDVAEQVPPDLSPTVQSATEPTRRRGFNSEYELQRVLELSREEAEREDQARKEKELANAKPDFDREAEIPALAPDLALRQPINDDVDRVQNPDRALSFWDFQPPEDDFTAEEHEAMLSNFREYPKKFGKIAQGLTGRSYKDCINHYYATKWNQQYKPPRDKRRSRGVKTPRVRGNAGVRPRANQLISNLDDAKPELYDGDEANAPLMAVTESGRPRRSAAPNFREREQTDASSSTPKRGQKADLLGSEKTARKTKSGARDRTRRNKAANTARQPSMSPEKQLPDLKSGPGDSRLGSSHTDMDSIQGSSVAALTKTEQQTTFAADYASSSLGPGAAEAGRMQNARGGHNAPSSYWSVHEVNNFPSLVKYYGTDWVNIAREMGSKSTTMVKNYYGRLKSSGKEQELETWAREADMRRERGEPPGELPTPAVASRRPRAIEQGGPSAPRPLAPSIEANTELDDEAAMPPSHGPAFPAYVPPQPYPNARHNRTSSFGQSSRTPVQVAAAPVHPQYAPVVHAPAEVRHAMERPEMRPVEHPVPRAPESTTPYASRGREIWDSPVARSSEVYSSPAFPRHSNPLAAPSRPQSPPRYSAGRPLFPPKDPLDRLSAEDTSRSFRPSEPSQAGARYVDSARTPGTPYYDPTRHSGPSMSREESRATRPYSQESPRPVLPVTKTEPRKTSNLAAILNADPDEAKPAAQPVASSSRIHTPPQYAPSVQSTYGAPVMPPARPLSQPSRHEPPPPDPSRMPLQHQRMNYGAHEQHEVKPRDPAPYRPAWPMAKSMQPRDRAMEVPPPFDPRAAVRTYDVRYNPSPPPVQETQPEPPRASYEQRLPPSHYGHSSYRAPSPQGRPYSHTPSGPLTHSRDSSSSRIPVGAAPLPPSRESHYTSDHRHSSSLTGASGNRGPPPPAPSSYASRSVYVPHAQHSPMPPVSAYGQDSRPRAPQTADWTQGIQYRDPPGHERGGEVERSGRDWDRGREREPDDAAGRETRDVRYGPATYVHGSTYQPRSDRGG